MSIPEPDCRMGYTAIQLAHILGPSLPAFQEWMSGQTMSICEGGRYNYETSEFNPDGCGPHGTIVYRHDLERFLSGQPIID